jgi:hypothetical protein
VLRSLEGAGAYLVVNLLCFKLAFRSCQILSAGRIGDLARPAAGESRRSLGSSCSYLGGLFA